MRFNGPDLQSTDTPRLEKQHERIKRVVSRGDWMSLTEIASITGDPEASISAQLRHLRKPRFGSYEVQRRRRTEGTYEYRVFQPKPTQLELIK